MEIINLRPPFRPQDAALFDLQIGPHLRLFNLSIRRLHSGRYRILAPNAFGSMPQLSIRSWPSRLRKRP